MFVELFFCLPWCLLTKQKWLGEGWGVIKNNIYKRQWAEFSLFFFFVCLVLVFYFDNRPNELQKKNLNNLGLNCIVAVILGEEKVDTIIIVKSPTFKEISINVSIPLLQLIFRVLGKTVHLQTPRPLGADSGGFCVSLDFCFLTNIRWFWWLCPFTATLQEMLL